MNHTAHLYSRIELRQLVAVGSDDINRKRFGPTQAIPIIAAHHDQSVAIRSIGYFEQHIARFAQHEFRFFRRGADFECNRDNFVGSGDNRHRHDARDEYGRYE